MTGFAGTLRPVDTIYDELSASAPHLFPSDITNPADQLMKISEVIDQIRGNNRPLYDIAEYVEGEKNTYENVVVLDTDIFSDLKPRNWHRRLCDYVYNNFAGKTIQVRNEDGSTGTIYFAKRNERVQRDGAVNSHRVIDELARAGGGNIKALAIVHLDEALLASTPTTHSDEHSHQWLDQNGWDYRTVTLQDAKGKIYEATLNIANARDGRQILYDVSRIREIDKIEGTHDGVVPSAQNGRGSHINQGSYEDRVPQSDGGVNSIFYDIADPAEEEEYRALDRAARQKAGAYISCLLTGWMSASRQKLAKQKKESRSSRMPKPSGSRLKTTPRSFLLRIEYHSRTAVSTAFFTT